MKAIFLVLSVVLLSACSSVPPLHSSTAKTKAGVNNQSGQAVQAFIEEMVQEQHFNQVELQQLLAQAEVKPQIITMMNRPLEKLSWARYQALYVRPSLIQGGKQFMQEHERVLQAIETKYGVPAAIIVSILGVETNFGHNQGSLSALDALYTLSFDYPRRGPYFQQELGAFLVLVREGGFNPLTVRSSYAGALGMPQFMPSTYLHDAVSESSTFPDLFHNDADAIQSIGHYLALMGWERGGPIAVRVHLAAHAKVSQALAQKTLSVSAFKHLGVHVSSKINGHLQAHLVMLKGQDGDEYWLIFHNFEVIKRYNASTLYAMAVYQLSLCLNT
jgi:membrane-bound lytic murein transglycosylase B